MDTVLKAVSGILVAAVLSQILSKQGKELSLLLVITVCCMVITAAVTFLDPVMDFFQKLRSTGNLNTQMMQILIKSVGIGLITEITILICNDMGNSALGKSLQILATAAVLWISLPLFEELLALLESVLEAV